MKKDFDSWLGHEVSSGLKDIKFAVGGDTSDASVEKAKQEILRIETLIDAGFTESLPNINDYSNELRELEAVLNP